VEAILKVRPDIALVDVGLPGLDGYEVARRVRADAVGGKVRLVALTGYGLPDDHRRSQEAGFDAHLVKPVDPGRLAAVIEAPAR
jgi:CheY-like chemotaxis protein